MTEFWYLLVILAVLFVLVMAGMHVLRPRDQFAALGNVRGKQIATVIRKLGDPTKVLEKPDGLEMRWIGQSSFRPSQLTLHVDHEGYIVQQHHKVK